MVRYLQSTGKTAFNEIFVNLEKMEGMTRRAIIKRTIKLIHTLPDDKVREISDFADFVIRRYEESQLTLEIQKLTEQSQTFDFLKDGEDLYPEDDLKEFYNG